MKTQVKIILVGGTAGLIMGTQVVIMASCLPAIDMEGWKVAALVVSIPVLYMLGTISGILVEKEED